jgi:quercetin dioxygenase-like cupin family protein
MVFNVGLDHFFAATRTAYGVVRARERLLFPERLDGREIAWEFESLDFAVTERRLSAYRVTFPAAPKRLRVHSHEDAEFVHVLSGRLVVTIGGEAQTLDPGDSIYFDAKVPHGYARGDGRPCAAIVVTTPA